MPNYIQNQIPFEKAFENPRGPRNHTICPSKHASVVPGSLIHQAAFNYDLIVGERSEHQVVKAFQCLWAVTIASYVSEHLGIEAINCEACGVSCN